MPNNRLPQDHPKKKAADKQAETKDDKKEADSKKQENDKDK